MDKKLLDALNNVSEAIQLLSETLSEKNVTAESPVSEALLGGNFTKQLESLNSGVQNIYKSTQEISKNQQTIMNMVPKESNKELDSDQIVRTLSLISDTVKNIQESVVNVLHNQQTVINTISEGSGSKETKTINDKLDSVLSISEDVGNIKIDTKQILANQKTILDVSKSKTQDKTGLLAGITDQKNKGKIKDGVSIILAIAAGVLAIGMAFKLIGNINVLSILAISAALPLIAIAFEKISKLELDPKNIKNLVLTTIGIATAVMLSSFILSIVKPVSMIQLTTTILIAGMFALISLNIDKLVKGIEGVNIKNVWKLPVILFGVSAAVAASSWILTLVKPVSILQLGTSILIAGMFAVISFGLGKLSKSMDKFKDKTDAFRFAALAPIVLVGISAAIALSSYLLSLVRPVGFLQLLTAALIGAAFIPISFAMPFIANSIKKVNPKEVILFPIMLVAMAASIMLSSYILAQTQMIPINLLFNIVGQAIALGVISLGLGFVIERIGKINATTLLKGALGIVIIAGAIMISSHILSIGNYSKYPEFDWTLGAGASLLVFGAATIGIGFLVTASGGIGAGAMLIGGAMVLVVAGAISLSSHILASGNYGKYPDMKWIKSVGITMTGFGLATITLGAMAITGIGAVAIAAGALAVVLVSKTIVKTAKILGEGEYGKYPDNRWINSVYSSLKTFGTGIMTIGGIVVATVGLGWVALKAGTKAVLLISESIVDSSLILQKGRYTGGPTKDWASGISESLIAFSPIFENISKRGILGIFRRGGSAKDMGEGIRIIAQGIIDAAEIFGKNKVTFTKGPSKDWSEGVSAAISSFSPIYNFLSEKSTILKGGKKLTKELHSAVIGISNSIVESSDILSKGNYGFNIPSDFMNNISNNIKSYVDLIKYLDENITKKKLIGGFGSVNAAARNIKEIAEAYDRLAESISKINSSLVNIELEKLTALKNITGGIVLMSLMDPKQFENMMDALEQKGRIFTDVVNSIEGGSGPANIPSGITVKTPTPPESTRTTDDIFNMLQLIESRLGRIQSDANKIQIQVTEDKIPDITPKN